MLRTTLQRTLLHSPVVVSVAVATVIMTVTWWGGADIDVIVMNVKVWEKWELWRAITSMLVHVDPLHLIFNLYWFFVFGLLLERVYGHLRLAGIILLTASISSLAEFALASGGVGLSGVGYGLWGLLFVLERHDQRFAGVVDARTNQAFVVWFFICIVFTITDILPIGNIAHATGALTGWLLGIAICKKGFLKVPAIAGIALLLGASLVGSTVLWPTVNLTEFAENEIERTGVIAIQKEDKQRAVELLEIAAHIRNAPARAWYNLGIAYLNIQKFSQATDAFQHAAALPDATEDMKRFADIWKASLPYLKTP